MACVIAPWFCPLPIPSGYKFDMLSLNNMHPVNLRLNHKERSLGFKAYLQQHMVCHKGCAAAECMLCWTQGLERWQDAADPAVPAGTPAERCHSVSAAQHGAAGPHEQLQAGLLRVTHALDAPGPPQQPASMGINR